MRSFDPFSRVNEALTTTSLRGFGGRAVFVRHGWLVLGTGDGLTIVLNVGATLIVVVAEKL